MNMNHHKIKERFGLQQRNAFAYFNIINHRIRFWRKQRVRWDCLECMGAFETCSHFGNVGL